MEFKPHFPQIFCKDGTELSCQASKHHYSAPRDDKGPYSAIEVGFPSLTPPDSWSQFAVPSDVYGWVPIEIVNEFIESHGGVDFVATFNQGKK